MEAKRNGLMKGKLVMPLYRAAMPSSSPCLQYSSKVVNLSPSTENSFIINRDYVTPQPSWKVSLVAPEVGRDSYTKFDNFYGVAADEGVDSKAAGYISSVKERFRLE